jgi:uncharacterized repeat protein (TIGR02543 family)
VYFGTSSPGTFRGNQPGTSYEPGTMTPGTTYYWRIDERNGSGVTTGTVWSFTTLALPGIATNPNPTNGATNVAVNNDLIWSAGAGATSHDVYFGTSSPGTFRGNQPGTTYDTGTMANGTTYYWRIDERNASGVTTGNVWSFTTIYTHTVTFIEGANGSITGTLVQVVNHGSDCTAVNAVADENYHFTGWTGDYVGMTNPLTITNVTADMTITANFAIDTFTLDYTAGAGGSLTGDTSQVVNCGDDGTAVEAIPNTGYHFVNWSDSSTDNPRTDLNVTANISVTANFAQSQYVISGRVMVAGKGLADVQMSGLPGDPCTDGNGNYIAEVDSGFSGVVTPVKAGYTFDPDSRTYDNVQAEQLNQNYKAMPSDDFNDNRRGAMWRMTADSAATWLSEDADLLNLGTPGWPNLISSCVGHWTLNDNADNTTVLDSSGNGHNGTAVRDTCDIHVMGKIDGALTFNGTTDYVNVGVAVTGAYTKAAWVKRTTAAGNFYNNIISSDTQSNFFWVPYHQSYKLTAGHNLDYYTVQDSVALPADGNYYFVAVTFDPAVGSGTMVLYKNGVAVDTATSVQTQAASTTTYIGRFLNTNTYNFAGSIDNAMVFNRALTADEITALYNAGNGTETLYNSHQASYTANGWTIDTAADFAVKVDYHYSDVSTSGGSLGMSVGDDADYVSVSVGYENGASYYYYEAAVGGSVVSEQEARTSDDGTLYITYDSAAKKFYLSHTGFGSGNAYDWQAPDPTQGQWSLPVEVSLDGGSDGAALGSGEAYLNDFEIQTAELFDWPPETDVDNSGYVDIDDLKEMAENWLDAGAGDIDDNGIVDFKDFAEFGPAW